MTDEIQTGDSELERLRQGITARRDDQLDAAQSVQGDFDIEAEQVGVESASRVKDTTAGELIGSSLKAGANVTAASTIGENIALHASGILKDDPEWNPREDEKQKSEIETTITELGLDMESSEAVALMASGSQDELYVRTEQIKRDQELYQSVADAGPLGTALFMAGTLADVDTLAGVGVFGKISKAKRVSRVNKLVETGVLKADEAAKLTAISTRGENLLTGAQVGAASAFTVEGIRAVLDPNVDEKDVMGAMIMGTVLGGGLGSAVPAQRVDRVAKDIAFTRVVKDIRKVQQDSSNAHIKEITRGVNTSTLDSIRQASSTTGVSESYLIKQAKVESGFNTSIKAKTSSATGLYQFIDSTWIQTLSANARKHGIDIDGKSRAELLELRKNPDIAATMAGEFAKTNAIHLKSVLGRKPNDTELYFAHFMGAGGASKFLRAKSKDGTAKAADIFKKEAKANKSIFYKKGGTARTMNEVYDLMDTKLNGESSKFSVDVSTNKEPVQNPTFKFDLDNSVGAAARDKSGEEVVIPQTSHDLMNQVDEWFDDNPDIDAAFAKHGEFVDELRGPLARASQSAAEKMYAGIQKTPLASNYDRLVNDAGVIGRYLAHHTVSNPVGFNVNNRSAESAGVRINEMVARQYAPNAGVHYAAWAKDKGIKKTSKSYYWKSHNEYGKELQHYRENLHAGNIIEDVHPSIKAASDDLDKAFKMSLEYNKRHGVEGFEDVEYINGHTPRNWVGDRFNKLEATLGSKKVTDALTEGIMRKTPDMDPKVAAIYAGAIRRAAMDKQLSSPVGSLMTVNIDGKASLERAIQDLGMDVELNKSAADIAESILYKNTEKGTVKSSRRRINIDMTTPIGNSDKTLLDLVDNDIYALADRTVRSQSNHAAMASVGIQHRDKAGWIQAARDEAVLNHKDPNLAAKTVDDVFSMFGEGAFGGGADAWASGLNKLAILSFLPQLGITQMAEMGVAMGVGGTKAYLHFAGKSMPEILKGKSPELMDNLYGIKDWVGDHRTFVSTNHLDDVSLDDAPKYAKILDMQTMHKGMDKGMRGMGYLSGFYKVNEMLHVNAALTMNNYMVKSIRDGKNVDRLATMGVDDEFRAIIQRKLDEGTIRFSEEGYVADMGTESWHPNDLELLQTVTRRNMDATVQKARRGEAATWQYQTFGSLFSSLKSFTFLAAQKQLIKNMALADAESFQLVLATTATAALAYSAKQVANGNSDKLGDAEYIAKGALNWSPLLSPLLMAVDPLSYMIGADRIEGSPFPLNSWRYNHSGLLSFPGISAANQLLDLPRVVSDAVDGDLSNDSWNSIKSIPIVGRSYPSVALIETLRD